jgi:hypothetical protein
MFVKRDGAWLTKRELAQVLAAIHRDSNSKPVNPVENSVSLLTSDARPSWAKARAILLQGESNAEHLHTWRRCCDHNFRQFSEKILTFFLKTML